MIGKTISHYKILEKLGEGGMGVVYKALDTKLKRQVAIKLLPLHSLPTDDDKARFHREARAAAALNHTNIAHVYEIDETDDGQAFIAMEYVKGEALAEKIKRGPLMLDEAITIACQLTEGLHAAHEQEIVHRDIKSSNIMLTAKGQVKVMDFGLARMEDMSKLTQEGTTVGTVSYMSPEQTRGEAVDHRSDIWSVGVVLYEMVTGRLPFGGDYEQAIVYSILNEVQEPLTAIRTGVPMKLEEIVNKLLAKEPGQRYQNIVELPVDLSNVTLQETQTSQIGTSAIAETISQEKTRPVEVKYSYATVLKALALVLPAIALGWILKPGPPSPDPARPLNLAISIPKNTTFIPSQYNRMAISPDGKDIAFIGGGETFRGLFLKRAGSFSAIELNGTERCRGPFFSPDGRWIGYTDWSTKEVYKILVDGGDPLRVTDFTSYHHYDSATWASDQTIVYTDNDILKRVSDSGGEAVVLTKTKKEDEQHLFPHMLPDGKTVLFTIGSKNAGLNTYRLAVYSFGDDDYRIILDEEGYNAVYSQSGHILYGRSDRLMGVRFDLNNLKITGVPVPVLENVWTHTTSGSMSYSISKEGTIAYIPGTGREVVITKVLSVDLHGQVTTPFDIRMDIGYANYSPNGKYIAFVTNRPDRNIWIYDIKSGALNQLTIYLGNAIDNLAWSPDGKTVAYTTTQEDSSNSIYLKNIDGSGTTRKAYTSPLFTPMRVKEWSADGDKIAFSQINGKAGADLFVYSFTDNNATLYFSAAATEVEPQFSPNGKWMLYRSDESGSFEVYVRPYPDSKAGIWKISNGGGNKPIWSPDGKRIYYHTRNALYSVDVASGDVFSKGNTKKLFEGDYFDGGVDRRFDVHPDGDRFIMIPTDDSQQRQDIFVIQNFFEELNRLVPVEKN